jgi:hypothetical protein
MKESCWCREYGESLRAGIRPRDFYVGFALLPGMTCCMCALVFVCVCVLMC